MAGIGQAGYYPAKFSQRRWERTVETSQSVAYGINKRFIDAELFGSATSPQHHMTLGAHVVGELVDQSRFPHARFTRDQHHPDPPGPCVRQLLALNRSADKGSPTSRNHRSLRCRPQPRTATCGSGET